MTSSVIYYSTHTRKNVIYLLSSLEKDWLWLWLVVINGIVTDDSMASAVMWLWRSLLLRPSKHQSLPATTFFSLLQRGILPTLARLTAKFPLFAINVTVVTLFILGRGRTTILLKWYHEEVQEWFSNKGTYEQGSGKGVVIRTRENVRRKHRIRNQYVIRSKWYDVCELLAPFRVTGVRMAVRHRKKNILNKNT